MIQKRGDKIKRNSIRCGIGGIEAFNNFGNGSISTTLICINYWVEL